MNIPVFMEVPFVDDKGNLTSAMQIYNDSLNQALQNGLSDNGWTTPQQTQAQIEASSANMPNGTFWYDTTNNEIVFKINGSLYKVTVTAYP